MKIVTSFSGRLYYTTGKDALRTMVRKTKKIAPVLAYHEDSWEHTSPMSGRQICEVDKLDGVEYIDLFKSMPSLKGIMKYSEWGFAKTYLNKNSPYFLRKTAAMLHAVQNNPPDLYLWMDCDCYMKKSFSKQLLDYVKQYDICYLDRKGISTDTGVLFFNLLRNPKVANFIKE